MRVIINVLIGIVLTFTNMYSQIEDTDLDSLLNKKVSTASKYWKSTSEVPATATIVTAKEIQAYGFTSLAEMLRTVSGFYVSDERNYNYTGVQSFSRPTDYMNRVLLLINGHPINDNIYGGAFINGDLALSMNSIEHVEIVRGPGSVLYGTSAMLAIVNIVTKEFNLVEQVNTSFEAGSFGRYQGSFNFADNPFNDFNFFLSGKIADVKGETNYSERVEPDSTINRKSEKLNWEKDKSLFLSLNYKNLSLSTFYSYRKKDIPTTSDADQFNNSDGYTNDEIAFTELKYDRELSSELNLIVRSYYDYSFYRHQWIDGPANYDKSLGNNYGFETQLLWDVYANNRLTIGGEYKNITKANYTSGNRDMVQSRGNFPYYVYGVYLQNEYQAYKNFSLSLGLRGDKYSTIGTIFTPRVALMYHPFELTTLKLLYGEAYRAPTTYELYVSDPHNNYIGNPDLKSEKIKTVELTCDQRLTSAIIASVSLYNYNFSNVIQSNFDSLSSTIQFSDYTKVYANGIEAEINVKPKEEIVVRTSYSFQYAKQEESGMRKSSSTCHLFKLALILPVIYNIYFASDMLYEMEKNTENDTRERSFYLANANIFIKDILNHFDLSFKLNNLTNTNYYSNSFDRQRQEQPEINQIGRNFLFKIEYKF